MIFSRVRCGKVVPGWVGIRGFGTDSTGDKRRPSAGTRGDRPAELAVGQLLEAGPGRSSRRQPGGVAEGYRSPWPWGGVGYTRSRTGRSPRKFRSVRGGSRGFSCSELPGGGRESQRPSMGRRHRPSEPAAPGAPKAPPEGAIRAPATSPPTAFVAAGPGPITGIEHGASRRSETSVTYPLRGHENSNEPSRKDHGRFRARARIMAVPHSCPRFFAWR